MARYDGVEKAFFEKNPHLAKRLPAILTDREANYEGFTEEEAQTIKEARVALCFQEKR